MIALYRSTETKFNFSLENWDFLTKVVLFAYISTILVEVGIVTYTVLKLLGIQMYTTVSV